MKDGFLKVCAATPSITAADCAKNGQAILCQIREAAGLGAKIIVFPELAITGATCGDLFSSTVLLQSAKQTLLHLAAETAPLDILCAVGLPLQKDSVVYNSCALFHKGKLLCVAVKSNLSPLERRVFSVPAESIYLPLQGEDVPCFVGADVLLSIPSLGDATVTVEIGSDSRLPVTPSAQNGALVVLHPSATPETVVSSAERLSLCQSDSRRLCCGIVTAEAGQGESTTDFVWGGQRFLVENGHILASGDLFTTGLTISELDVDYLQNKRRAQTFPAPTAHCFPINVPLEAGDTTLTRTISPTPFLPFDTPCAIAQRVERILDLQCAGLSQRLTHTHCKTAVIGLSGGLDSTLALLVTARTFDLLHRDRKDILAVTLPCFGTTSRTKSNAQKLAEALGVSFREIQIGDAVRQHFLDIGQSMDCHDVTFENSQARERTQVLMDVANRLGGMVIGTGDLSELALGWATYNGDHMSMYGINGSIPKTLMRVIVQHMAQRGDPALSSVLLDILDTPVSPELLPAKDGEIAQKTEELVGPYALHDFFLYHALGNGFTPEKIRRLAKIAFDNVYDDATIDHWLKNFYRRFFAQQFKRSCLPDGPAVGSISLSPRTGLMIGSDLSGAMWQARLS